VAHVEKHHRKPCARVGCAHGFARHGKSAKGACTAPGCGCQCWKAAPGDQETIRARWRDLSGKEHSKKFPRKLDAERFLAKVEGDKLKGSYVDPDAGRTLFRVVAERWYTTTKGLQPPTRRDYRSLLDVWILPRFGALPVAAIDTLLIEEWLADTESRLSPSRARRAYYVLRGVLGAAVKGEMLAANRALGVDPPKVKTGARRFLDAEQVEALAGAIRAPYGVLVRFGAYSGMRWSEVVELEVRNLDLLRGTVHVERSKSGRKRDVHLPRFLCEALGAYLADRPHGPRDRVFTAPRGGALHHRNFSRRAFEPAVAAAGLPEDTTFHALRHACASILAAQGAGPKEVQEHLGHADASVTLKVYTHLFKGRLEHLAERMDAAHRAAAERQTLPSRDQGSAKVIPMAAEQGK
jgi:integrase